MLSGIAHLPPKRYRARVSTTLDGLPRDRLLAVVHEYMLLGMLSNQATLPQTIVAGGTFDDLNQVAIDLWMGASPVYTHRMRRLMGIEGDDVPAIMKALQLDVGFVHQYMHVHYQVNDPLHGEFWLEHCGALINLEPHGTERVRRHVPHDRGPDVRRDRVRDEPRARIRPIHRPPRVPADRKPHCHWTIIIDPANDPVGPARLTQQVARHAARRRCRSNRARRATATRARSTRSSGSRDCSDDDARRPSRASSRCRPICSCARARSRSPSGSAPIAARDLLADAWLATAWVGSERLRDVLGADADVAAVLALHPAIPPGFTRTVERDGDRVRCTLTPESAALLDPGQPGWIGALARGETRGIEGIVQPIDRRARVERVDGRRRPRRRSTCTSTRTPSRCREPDVVAFMRVGMLSTWKFSLS